MAQGWLELLRKRPLDRSAEEAFDAITVAKRKTKIKAVRTRRSKAVSVGSLFIRILPVKDLRGRLFSPAVIDLPGPALRQAIFGRT